jgi:hypothetical protein
MALTTVFLSPINNKEYMDIYENKYSLVLLFINCNFINEE